MGPSLRSQSGFTIIEALVASLVLLMGVMAVATLIDTSNSTTTVTRSRLTATNMARELVEAARGISYKDIADGGILQALQAAGPNGTLADSEPGNPYTIERKGLVYTITADTCILDDGRDGGGAIPRAGDFCPDSVAAGTLDKRTTKPDTAPEDYKRVKVTATWTFRGDTRQITQTTFVNNPGSAGAPAVLTLTASGFAGSPPPQVAPGKTSIDFSTTTSSQPHSVKWLLDGVTQGWVCQNCSGVAQSFTWNLDSPVFAEDGPYLITAEAYDKHGIAGATRSMTLVVNRGVPRAPRGFTGGRHAAGFVELEWLANPERDVIGYRVSRLVGGGEQAVPGCELILATRCVDNAPPAGDVTYHIHAFDNDLAGKPRESPNYTNLGVVAQNKPPFAPTDVKRVDAGNEIRLTWLRPDPQDPDAGDSIAFYRIYRDGTAIGDRYGKADDVNGTGKFVDLINAGESHTYYVVAVDRNNGESAPILSEVSG